MTRGPRTTIPGQRLIIPSTPIRKQAVGQKIWRWVIFGMVVSTLPLFFSYLIFQFRSEPATLTAVLGNGELLVVLWPLCAAAIGELFGSDPNLANYKIVSGGSTTVILILSTLLFAFITNARLDKTIINDGLIIEISIVLFIFGVISCLSCIYLSEK
jgi:hypothetical protein